MRRLASLTNPNKNTENKANFFVDYFHFYFYSAGKFTETELDYCRNYSADHLMPFKSVELCREFEI